ncbi:TRAP transporter small permease [Roseomonas sp. M0104]|uniref:TRAP transporter small permease protein n=1 Tax=Teichococcus coralli TaxID=2545983 RepID=A0A845BBJ1_9PROT|nr:TRAP transporter small permease [Pseudoroseomonas coralli]MXP63510.1 TRAP transporter small permease [Pseudoroseomonas coralli]
MIARLARLSDRVFTLAEWLLVLALGIMVVMVFGNVVLRYAFNSGITVTDEVSRLLFVWLTFLGAVVVLRQGGHLGFDLVTAALPRAGKQVCRVISGLLILVCCAVLLRGSWEQAALNMGNLAPVSGVPLGWTYASAVVAGVGLGLLTIADLVAALMGHEPPEHHAAGEAGA